MYLIFCIFLNQIGFEKGSALGFFYPNRVKIKHENLGQDHRFKQKLKGNLRYDYNNSNN